MTKPTDKSTKSHQLSQVQNDQTNIFHIENPQILPPLTQKSINALRELLHTRNINSFNQKSRIWVNYLIEENRLNQMVIKVKEANIEDDGKLPKYSIELYPVYEKFSVNHFISNKQIQVSGTFHNLTSDSFKNFMSTLRWNYVLNEFSIAGHLLMHGPWRFKAEKKWGTPLDNKWVFDQRNFSIKYLLSHDSRRTGSQTNYLEHERSSLYWKMKGYETRLKRNQRQEPGIYLNQEALKKVDIIEAGYQRSLARDNGRTRFGINFGVGTDYYHTWYGKVQAYTRKVLMMTKKFGVIAYSEAGAIQGKNVIPHEMFSRNQTKWMGERSKLYGHCRLDLFARGIPLLETLELIPSNYISLWGSKSFENKVKFEVELGVSLSAINSSFRLDFNFLRLAGVKGEPRFGLKYQF